MFVGLLGTPPMTPEKSRNGTIGQVAMRITLGNAALTQCHTDIPSAMERREEKDMNKEGTKRKKEQRKNIKQKKRRGGAGEEKYKLVRFRNPCLVVYQTASLSHKPQPSCVLLVEHTRSVESPGLQPGSLWQMSEIDCILRHIACLTLITPARSMAHTRPGEGMEVQWYGAPRLGAKCQKCELID